MFVYDNCVCRYDNSARRAPWGSLHPRHAHIMYRILFLFLSVCLSFSFTSLRLLLCLPLPSSLFLLTRRPAILQFNVPPYGITL